MRVKLSLMGDMCMPQPFMLSWHDSPCLEMPTPVMWMPGFALQQNNLTTTVIHKGQFIALEGHDCGYWIPHIWTLPLPPLPILLKLPLIIASSKRKMVFSSSTVKANDGQIACSQFFGGVPVPMLTCGSPVSPPNTFPVFNFFNDVSVNMTVGDLMAGIIAIVLSIACDVLCKVKWLDSRVKWLGKARRFAKAPNSDLMMDVLEHVLGAGSVFHFGMKTVFGVATNAARVMLTGEGEFKLDLLSSYVGFKAGVEYKRDGGERLVVQSQHITGMGTRQDKHVRTYQGDTLTKDEQSTVDANAIGIESTTNKVEYGKHGKYGPPIGQETTTVWTNAGVASRVGDPTASSSASTLQMTRSVPSQGTSVSHFEALTPESTWGGPL
jgi:hypothetical protein